MRVMNHPASREYTLLLHRATAHKLLIVGLLIELKRTLYFFFLNFKIFNEIIIQCNTIQYNTVQPTYIHLYIKKK